MLEEIKLGLETADKLAGKGQGVFNQLRKPYQRGEEILTKAIYENGEITSDDIQAVAMQFMVKKFVKKIKNYDSIITKAERQFEDLLKQTSEKIPLSTPDDDWIEYFFDMSSRVSNKTVQEIWARILLQEHIENGRIKKVMLNSLALLDADMALAFKAICTLTYRLTIDNETRLIPFVLYDFNVDRLLEGYTGDVKPFEKYKEICPGERELEYLAEIGLITTTNLTSSTYTIYSPEKTKVTFEYCGESVTIDETYNEEEEVYETQVSFVFYTQVGLALYETLAFPEHEGLFPVLKRFAENQMPYTE